MAYRALYREWRPKKFDDMVGQEHVRVILTNAIKQNKIAHAYMFSGPRGTGKTSAAKLLAKTLNCRDRDGVEPCNACSSCLEIDQGTAIDVLEIDAASNRGIDEIRDLRDKVKLAASGGRYKVYIIDEVHMLTSEAFNALLKTLEEPPANVVFILATTEANKVPLTILSRVQRFEFHRISVEEIVTRLRDVCQTMGREIEDKALQVIAVKAEGGLRDALSILDQCLLHNDPIQLEHVYQIIGMVGETYSADLTDALLIGDYGLALAKLGEGISLGRDPRQVIKELLEYLRQLLLYTAGGQEPLLAPDMVQRLIAQSERIGMERLLTWINVLLKGDSDLRFAPNARLAAEMILVQTIFEPTPKHEQKSVQRPASLKTEVNPRIHTALKTDSSHNPAQAASSVSASTHNPSGSATGDTAVDFVFVQNKWPDVLEGVKKKKKSTHAFLLEGRAAELRGDQLLLIFKDGYSFHRDKFNQIENKQVVEEVLEQVLGAKLLLNNLIESEYRAMPAVTSGNTADNKSVNNINADADADGLIQKARELFGEQWVQVKKD
ncbi:DNA polymerase III subunit gamma/tau [Dehalobacter sp. DCM]|uniref:DNA polymerase III subunit gamma/tau n=1 Tax=Dehalobacter sp. DCM TaxID=2907827 RepID=UPI00308219E3|nr:DNA polymerase III subunit gamma/tau [Dehalobacter sp. DCM]